MLIERFKESMVRRGQTSQRQELTRSDLARIEGMFLAIAEGDPRAGPSKYWVELNKLNVAQMNEYGYKNFKRTVALNYFTWTKLLPWDSQISFLCRHVRLSRICSSALRAIADSRRTYFASLSWAQAVTYNFLTYLLWEYLLRLELPPNLLTLREPAEGNAPLIEPRPGMQVSQDLANSILEYDSFRRAIGDAPAILELGAGYGRTAFVTLSMHPRARYVVVDIPPALWVAERYLRAVLPGRRIFRYRDFQDFESVRVEFERADLIFLLSNQINKLPKDSFDLIVNISSLHEMRQDQISFYFGIFDKVLKSRGMFYTKQWRHTKVLFEGVSLAEADYPIPGGWAKILRRVARVQTKFFEALYQKIE